MVNDALEAEFSGEAAVPHTRRLAGADVVVID
jgi:hypothetical protein